MSQASRAIDRYYALKIMQILNRDFQDWPAFRMGIIDASGNLIRKARTKEEKDSYTRLDAVLRSLKQILNKFPGGVSALARAYITKGFIYESVEFKEIEGRAWGFVRWLGENYESGRYEEFESPEHVSEHPDIHMVGRITIGCLGYQKGDPFLTSVFEEMVAGDSGGDPEKIASGVTSGAVTTPGPQTLKKKKVDKKKDK